MHNNLKEVFQSEPIVNQDTTKAMEDVRLLQVTEHEAVSLEEFTTKEEKVRICLLIFRKTKTPTTNLGLRSHSCDP